MKSVVVKRPVRSLAAVAGKMLAVACALLPIAPALRAQSPPPAPPPGGRPNVLFIAVDDLRPMLGCYGDTTVKTPNIDRLAASGTVFQRAYCQQAVCAPSRNSLLTGKRPDSIGIYDLQTFFRTKLPDAVTLPQHFKGNGYTTARTGKIFHTAHGNRDDARSWSSQKSRPDAAEPGAAPRGLVPAAFGQPPPGPRPPQPKAQPAYGAPDVPDERLQDGQIAANAAAWLREFKKQPERPFFLAVGFLKPHLPFVAPKRYWDLYDPAKLSLAAHRDIPEGAPRFANNGPGEARTYEGIPKQGPIPDDLARTLIHGYHASVSYVDAQVGRVLGELDRLGLRDNTIVVLWGDHGFQLGEHGNWCKHNNYEKSTHAPLLVSAPGAQYKRGAKTRALTEFVDIYPSLCELAGLPKPAGLEGDSFVPLLKDPGLPGKRAAYSQWPRREGGGANRRDVGMGYAVRTDRYRFMEWITFGDPKAGVAELYDYEKDPLESVNIAGRPENTKLVAEMRALLRAVHPAGQK